METEVHKNDHYEACITVISKEEKPRINFVSLGLDSCLADLKRGMGLEAST